MEDINLTKCKWNGACQQEGENSCTVRCHKRILCQNPPKRYFVKSTASSNAHTGKSSLPLEPFLSQGHLLPMKAVALYVLTPSWMSHIKQETEISHNGIWHALNFWIALPLNEFHLKTYQTMRLQSVQSQNVHSLPTYLCWSCIRINMPGLLRKSDPTPKVYKWYLLCFLNRRMNQNSSLFCI